MVESLTREQLRTEIVCSVEQAGATLGFGSARAAYRAAAKGYIPTISVGARRKVVPVRKLAALVAELETELPDEPRAELSDEPVA